MLGKFISVREPNIKYLGLENMVRLAEVPAVADTINRCILLPCCLHSPHISCVPPRNASALANICHPITVQQGMSVYWDSGLL